LDSDEDFIMRHVKAELFQLKDTMNQHLIIN